MNNPHNSQAHGFDHRLQTISKLVTAQYLSPDVTRRTSVVDLNYGRSLRGRVSRMLWSYDRWLIPTLHYSGCITSNHSGYQCSHLLSQNFNIIIIFVILFSIPLTGIERTAFIVVKLEDEFLNQVLYGLHHGRTDMT